MRWLRWGYIAAPLVVGALALVSLSDGQVILPPTTATQTGCAFNTSPPTLTNGQLGTMQCDAQGQLKTTASVSASIAGFNPTTTGTPIAVTNVATTGTLPAGAVVVATNVGTTNGAYCKLGASATTSDQYIAPNGGWFQFTTSGATQLTCITASSTTTVNMVGGSGLPTGTGGGGGGGGGGAVTIADGANVTQGAIADAAATVGSTGTLSAKLRLMTTQLDNINTNIQATGLVIPQAGTTGASSTTGNIAANNTTAVVVKASAGTLYSAQLYSIGSAPAYLKIYNATSATCGAGTPVKRLMIPAASTAANGAGSNIDFGAAGIAFGTGITYCVTTGITDADSTAPAANTFLINLDWK